MLLGWWLLATLTVAFVFLGGVQPSVQAALHLMVALGATIALAIPDRKLACAGVTHKWIFAGSFPLAALALGLVPVPRGVAAWVAPGLISARPSASWTSLATDVGRVPGELATAALIIGFGALVATWGASRFRRDETETALTVVTGALAASGLLHAGAGATSMLGVVRPDYFPSVFFAPFVNPNHAASAMLLGGPIAMGMVLNRDQPAWKRGLAGCVSVAAAALIASVGSNGALSAVCVIAVVWVVRGRNRLYIPVLPLALALMGGVQVWAGVSAWDDGSAISRAGLWRNSIAMVSDFWLAGTGGGTFEQAIRAYRTDHVFQTFAHTHNDPLEWLAETGGMGVIAALACATALWPGALREGRRGDGLVFGLLGLGLHVLVEFPLQIPGIALAAAGVGACVLAVFAEQRPASPRAVRGALVAVGLLQLPAAAWQAREAFVARAVEDVHAFPSDPARAARGARDLVRVGGGVRERLLFAAWSAETAGDAERAAEKALELHHRFPDQPDALRAAALVLARAGRYHDATTLLLRAAERDPSDYRPWVALARVAHVQQDGRLAASRWSEAFARSAPGTLDEAYTALPLGLFWLEAFERVDARYSAALAQKLVKEDDLEVALLACEQAAQLDPERYGDLLLKASVLVKLGRAGQAEPWVTEILARRPDDPYVLAEYALVLGALGRHEEATAAYLSGARGLAPLKLRALTSAEAAGGTRHAIELSRRFELEGTMDPALGLAIARLHQRAGDSSACVFEIERWRLIESSAGARAAALLQQCRADGR